MLPASSPHDLLRLSQTVLGARRSWSQDVTFGDDGDIPGTLARGDGRNAIDKCNQSLGSQAQVGLP